MDKKQVKKPKTKYPFKEKFGKNVWVWIAKDKGHWQMNKNENKKRRNN